MGETRKLGKKALLDLVCRLLALNFSTFLSAYPQIPNIDSGCCSNQPLAKDFSGVYIGAWRLFNDPGLQPYKREGMAFTIIAEVIVLLVPAPAPGWGFSIAYFWQ